MIRPLVRAVVVALAIALLGTACSSSSSASGDTSQNPEANQLQAAFASFDVTQNTPSRILLGLQTGNGRFIGFGTVSVTFTAPDGKTTRPPVPATYVPIPGSSLPSPIPTQPTFVNALQRGVYETAPQTFGAGIWTATVYADVKRLGKASAATPVAVGTEHGAVAVGERAPASVNPTIAHHGKLPLSAVDSRAQGNAPVPDPELHRITVKDALAAHRPIVIVVSTPVYCQSRFCGPTTDLVEQLAKIYSKQAAFIHIEVWADYANQVLNKAAAEWIARGQGDGNEPWVFIVGRDGIVKARFDNVVTRADLVAAIEKYAK